jgi:ribosomal protein S18 acetylase RimI-like enzyme
MPASQSRPAQSAIRYRLVEPRDEAAVRRICFDTALYGQSMRTLLDDRTLISEALVGYYLRFEPDALFVADAGEAVVGYLTGCLDTRRFVRQFALHLTPRLVLRFLCKGHVFRPAAWRLLLGGARHAAAWKEVRAKLLDSHPAHLHLNLDIHHRGRGVAAGLLREFLALAACRGVRGVHLSTETQEGRKFFHKSGFHVIHEYRLPSILGGAEQTIWLMARPLGAEDGKESRHASDHGHPGTVPGGTAGAGAG